MQTQPFSIMKLQSILKRLIGCEIVLIILAVGVEAIQYSNMPPLLQQYEESLITPNWSWRDWVMLCLGIPSLVLLLAAWTALWRGWRSGRCLYTIAWCALLLFNLFLGPTVTFALTGTLDSTATLIGGIILGLLYFSDLRYQYEPLQYSEEP
jgi:hypothetical protein